MHHWSDDDNLIAYCLYRFGDHVFGIDRHELGDVLGMGFNSLGLKVANFKAIDGLGGMEQYSQQALRIHTRYSNLPDDEVRQAGRVALLRASDGAINQQKSAHSRLSDENRDAELARLQRQLHSLQAQIDQTKRRLGLE